MRDSRRATYDHAYHLVFVFVLISLVHSQSFSEEELSKAANCFTYRFYQQLAKDNGNLICSPFSLDILLSILRTGAGGITNKELTTALGYENLSETDMENAFHKKMGQLKSADGNTLDIANSAWIQNDFPVNPTFMDVVTNEFNSDVKNVDFLHQADSATNQINEWGKSKTQGLIPKLFDGPLDPNTVMVLVNAIYFKGTWSLKFNKDATKPGDFKNKDSSNAMSKVHMMHQRANLLYHEDSDLNAQVLELFYTGENKSMVILLPQEGSTLAQMESALSCDTLSNAVRSGYSTLVDLTMPKFDLSSDFDLIQPMKNVGIKDVFEPSANFSRIAKNIYVSKAVQKAIIQVYEEGTKAAALTGLGMMRTAAAMPSQPRVLVFNANHPFLFFVRDKLTNLILFMGKVNDLPSVA